MAKSQSTLPRPTDAPPTARYWTALAAWPVMAVFIASNIATPLYPVWQQRIGFSSGTLTVIFAGYIAGLLAALLVAGVVSDRVGRKPVLLPAIGLAITASAIFATADTVAALVIARLLTGLATGAAVSAGMAAVADVTSTARKPLASLLASMAMVAGAGLGPLLAGTLSETLPGPTVLVFGIEILLLGSAFAVVWRMPLPSRETATRGGSWVRVPNVPRRNQRHLWPGIAVFAPGITATSFVLSLGPSLLADITGTDNRVIAGLTAFVMFVTATAVQFAARRLPLDRVLLIGALFTVVSMVVLIVAVATSALVLLMLAAVSAGAGQGLGQLGGLTLLSRHIPTARTAEANAALNVGGYVAAGVLPVSAGYLSDAMGLAAGTTGFGIFLILVALAGAAVIVKTRTTYLTSP